MHFQSAGHDRIEPRPQSFHREGLAELRTRCSVYVGPLLDRLLEHQLEHSAETGLIGSILVQAGDEIELLDAAQALSAQVAPIDRATLAGAVQRQRHCLEALVSMLTDGSRGPNRACTSVGEDLRSAIVEILVHTSAPELAKLLGEHAPSHEDPLHRVDDVVPWERLCVLHESLRRHAWESVESDLSTRCWHEFGVLCRQSLLGQGCRATSTEAVGQFKESLCQYCSWRLEPAADTLTEQLIESVIDLAGRQGPERTLEWLEMARRLHPAPALAPAGVHQQACQDFEESQRISSGLFPRSSRQ